MAQLLIVMPMKKRFLLEASEGMGVTSSTSHWVQVSPYLRGAADDGWGLPWRLVPIHSLRPVCRQEHGLLGTGRTAGTLAAGVLGPVPHLMRSWQYWGMQPHQGAASLAALLLGALL